MKRNRLWALLACSTGAVVGLYLFAAYSGRHPQSWAGRATHRLCRLIYPSDRNFRPLQADPVREAAPPDADRETEIADRTAPERTPPPPVPAPERVAVHEPILIEPPTLEFRAGVEESDFPIIIDLPPQGLRTPLSPPRMRLADEPTPEKPVAFAAWRSLLATVWHSALELGLAVFPPSAPSTTYRGATLGPIEPLGSATGLEESAVVEPLPVDPRSHERGGHGVPSQYRQFEIPAVNPTMPEAR